MTLSAELLGALADGGMKPFLNDKLRILFIARAFKTSMPTFKCIFLSSIQTLLHVDNLAKIRGTFMFNCKIVNFKLLELGYDRMALSKLSFARARMKITVITGRWFAILQQDGRYFMYNCHPPNTNASIDMKERQPAAVLEAAIAFEAAFILQAFGCMKTNPNSYFEAHLVIKNPKKMTRTWRATRSNRHCCGWRKLSGVDGRQVAAIRYLLYLFLRRIFFFISDKV